MTSSRPSAFHRFCAATVVAALLLQPLGAYAAPITTSVLAEKPLQGFSSVKPNILFTLDDSGSMGWDYLPDWTTWKQAGLSYCRDNRQCGGTAGNAADGSNVGSLPSPGPFTPYKEIDPPIRSSDFNKVYYNPAAIYIPGKRDDGTDLPCEGTNTGCTGPWTKVYMDGYAGYPGANTSGATINLAPTSAEVYASPLINGPWPGVPDTVWCNSSDFESVRAGFRSADGDGSMCRRNGRAYPAAGATPAIDAGYNYPNGGTTCAAGEACNFLNPFTVYGYPFYYTISNVWFCSSRDAAGWGTGTCGTRQDPVTYKYVRYSASATSGPGFDPKAFTRVDITPFGFLVNGVAKANPSGRTYATEMANFAKWYAFHRTRMLTMKTASGIAFSALTDEIARVGFATLFAPYSLFLNVNAFDNAQKTKWFNQLYSALPGCCGTPLPTAVRAAGEYFSNSGNSGFPGATDPLDVKTGQCQANYHLLSTDGYWNVPLSSGNVGDQDKTVPSLPITPPSTNKTGFTPGALFPPGYYEGPTATSNTLADLAMKYWINDIRTLEDKVQDKERIAPWQHVTLYGISIGAQGNIVYPGGLKEITGTPANPGDPNAKPPILPTPAVAPSRDWPAVTGLGGPDSIDDLWHAAFNSRGQFFNPDNPQKLAEDIVKALSDFTSKFGTGTGVGIASAVNAEFAYRTSYEVGWWGDVRKYKLDATGGLPSDPPVLWSAAEQLDKQVAAGGWDTNRRIVMINDSSNAAGPFRLNQLSNAQKASLNAGWSVVASPPSTQSVLNYLRGDPSNEEQQDDTVSTTKFRKRFHTLGDIVYSGAVPVGAPKQPYDDPGYNEKDTGFVTKQKSRAPMVYVGSNDGMLHAFIDTPADGGKEAWAYVPKALFSAGDPNDTAHAPSHEFQIGALSYRNGGIPPFKPHFYVNATPRIWDVDFARTNGKTPPQSVSDWRTMLVGGLGAGGRAVYALDVTKPVALTETESDVSKRVLWEFTHDNLGYVYDAPTLVKTYRYGWVVLVASGYNNPGGKGFLYILNPETGAQLREKMALPGDTGTDTSPTGLSTIRAYSASRKNPYVLQAYGGDLKGNVWRFDLSDPDESKWNVDLIAQLTDKNDKPQPITTGVRVEIDQNNNVDRYLFVGTGKLLGPNDIDDASVWNTLYVIRDGTRTAPELAPAKQSPARGPYTRADLNSVAGTCKDIACRGAVKSRGWYQDAIDSKEKIGTDVHADVQTVVYSFSKPSDDPCEADLKSTLYARDFTTGNSVLQSAGGAVVASITDIGAIAGVAMIQTGVGVAGASSGDVRVQVTTMKGQVFSFGVQLAGASPLKHRISWRLLNRQ